ncbi:MAG TPA: LUD domain-containing protein [Chitinophagaceae bacterium]|nr:LUD domain-containing protein [Chitinophagaceae bacterium]
MSISPSKENILKRIRKALSHPTPIPFPQSEGKDAVFNLSQQENAVEFAEQFTKLQGKFIYCQDRKELGIQLNNLVELMQWSKVFCCEEELEKMLRDFHFDKFSDTSLKDCDVSITGCEVLVAQTGSIVLSAAQTGGRTASVYAPVHVCIAFTSQVKTDLKQALQWLKDKYGNELPSMISFATGPSRTADIEKTLVVGVHGPKEVFLLLVEA